MIEYPNAKINLGLHILGKRSDGFHNLETIFYPTQFCDILEINKNEEKKLHFTQTGLIIPKSEGLNLCEKAYYLLKEEYDLPYVNIHLHKQIPTGAGLGGGSADASFTINMLNVLFDLKIPLHKRINYAAELGSDCPFFIINKPCIATGRGEVLKEIDLHLDATILVIANPNIHVSTAKAFKNIDYTTPSISLLETISQPITNWKNNLGNHFEKSIFKAEPKIKEIKEMLYNAGATYASMSGSGASVIALFNQLPQHWSSELKPFIIHCESI